MLFSLIGLIWKKMPKSARRWLTRRVQTSFTVSVAGVITNERGKVLLLNHVLRPVSGWGLPGGFVNAGEQPEAAFRREIYEETGLKLSNVGFVHVRTLHRHLEIIFCANGIGEGVVKSREITELGWFELDKMPEEMSMDQQLLILNVLRPDDSKKEMG